MKKTKKELTMNPETLFKISYGLFVITAKKGDGHNGCIINTVGQVASEPNRISFSINKQNLTRDLIDEDGNFTVSIISEEADFELFKHFGFRSGRSVDKFADFPDTIMTKNGTLAVTKGTNAYISGKVAYQLDLDSHTLFVADVTEMEVLSSAPSATYAYYHASIKPKKEAKAPAGKTVWRCKICGYEYEGEELPADFICPLCKHPASDFEKVNG